MAYLSLEELRARLNEKVLARFEDEDCTAIETALEDASSEADAYLEAVYGTTPLEDVPPALKMHVSRAVLYHLLSAKAGFSPDSDDAIVVANYNRAIEFYKDVQKRKAALPQAETAPARQRAVVVSNPVKRGW